MSSINAPKVVVPTPQKLKTFGLLNIVFASLLGLLAVMSVLSLLMRPVILKVNAAQMARTRAQFQAQQEAQREKTLKRMEVEEEEAQTEEAKQAVRDRRAELTAKPVPQMPDMSKMMNMYSDPSLLAFTTTDAATGFLLNGALLAAGIGLTRMREWGRRLSIWISAIKLVRIVGLAAFAVLVVVPRMSHIMGDFFIELGQQIAAEQGPQKGAQVLDAMRWVTKIMGASMAGSYVLFYLLATIYPIVLWRAMTRPGVRAATQVGPPDEPPALVEDNALAKFDGGIA